VLVADAVVLDTSAILTLTGNEPGADEVQTYLSEAIAGRIQLHGSFASLTEVEYITAQEEGEEAARRRIIRLAEITEAKPPRQVPDRGVIACPP
jgi:PIN domain nuclease of toxin-antitoxin system